MEDHGGAMNALAAARALARWWPAAATVAPETGLSVCIETTKTVVESFRRAGYKNVAPLACELHLYNAAATMAMLQGGEPTHSACRIEVSPEAAARLRASHGYAGHLVVEHPQFLLDLVLPGVVRAVGSPAGFESVGPGCFEKHAEIQWIAGAWTGVSSEALAVRYVPRRRLKAWRNTDAWRGDVDDELCDIIADALRGSDAELEERAAAGS